VKKEENISIWGFFMEFLNGVVERITYCNEETGFTVLKIKVRGFQELVTVVGEMAGINVGSVLELKGNWRIDSKYGKQFQVEEYAETVPATVAGIEKYLGSGLIKGIGPVNARRIVKKFKEDTLRIIEEEPDRLLEVDGIGEKRLEMIKKGWQEQKEIKNVMLFLQSHGVSTAYAVKIYKTYGNDSIKLVRENPYRLADEIWGIGFKTADKIAQKLGFALDSSERCQAAVIYALNQLANEGHCFVYQEDLIGEVIKLLEIEEATVETSIEKLLTEKRIIKEEDGAIYLPVFYYCEVGVAARIQEILGAKSSFRKINIDNLLSQIEKENGVKYDDIQIKAIREAVQSKFMVLTGGPGTGKTTTTLAIIRIFERLGAKIMLAAPTGRAAKRMSETTGREAKTIHRLLEYSPAEGYKRNSENPLDCDVLIVDETSMVDILLMYNLLKAVQDDTVVVLVGDVDQLPSVGAGNVLKDIINSGLVSVVKLERIFRQAQGSKIITNAHKINSGRFPDLSGGKNSDFFFIKEDTPEKIVAAISELCARRLPRYYRVDPINDIQVLCPMTRGEVGTVNLNVVLQETLNPRKTSIKYGGTTYKLGDKVMQIKNNYDKNVFNGDIGRIISIDEEDKLVTVSFDDSLVNYDFTELDQIVLAYATTVHKSQGSEYPIVVAPLVMQHYMMLQRNLLYTCVTRAKKVMVLIGTPQAIGVAVKNSKITKRNTKLAERLKRVSDSKL